MNAISRACILGAAAAVAMLTLSRPSHAGDLAYAPNQANGAIVLTDDQGRCPQGSKAYYTTDAGGKASFGGCWMYSDPWVVARDTNGQSHQWMTEQFTLTDYAKQRSSKTSM